jgi:hypothetical protein
MNAVTKIEAGSILQSSWGYDQTNIDFYKVISVKNGWASVAKIGQEIVENMPEYMGEKVVPFEGKMGSTFRRKIKTYSTEDYVGITSYSCASVWDGQPQMQTHTH